MKLNEHQLDALRELGNIGASHAAASLSMMLGSAVDMTVPEVEIVDIAGLTRVVRDEISAFVIFEIQGEIAPGGYLGLFIPKTSAIRLTNTMLGMTDTDREINEMDESALLEVGNIMMSQFLDATATLLNIVMLPSPPDVAIDMAHAMLQSVIAEISGDINSVILFSTELVCQEHEVTGSILLMPRPPMLTDLLTLLDKVMNGSA
ncbi:MAG: chemotaxis protein CheC [Methanomicrobiaceae archaeon]|nr:chemotaxis protein CheC [Methanomicrobiaceae archaeon]